HTRSKRDWSSDVCSSDLADPPGHLFLGQLMQLPQDHQILGDFIFLHFHTFHTSRFDYTLDGPKVPPTAAGKMCCVWLRRKGGKPWRCGVFAGGRGAKPQSPRPDREVCAGLISQGYILHNQSRLLPKPRFFYTKVRSGRRKRQGHDRKGSILYEQLYFSEQHQSLLRSEERRVGKEWRTSGT